MFEQISISLSFLPRKVKFKLALYSAIRIALSVLDILGILIIGLLVSKSSSQLMMTNSSTNNSIFSLQFFNNLSLINLGILGICLFLSKSLLATFFLNRLTKTLGKIESDIAESLFARLLQSPNVSLFETSRSEITLALTSSISYGTTLLFGYLMTILSETALLIAIATTFMIVNVQISIFIVLYFFVIGLSIHKFISPRLQRAGNISANSSAASMETINDSLMAYREIVTLQKEPEFINKFAHSRATLANVTAKIGFYSSLPRYIVESALIVGTIALAAYSFVSAEPQSAAGMLGIFLTGGLRVMASLLPLQGALGSLKQSIAQATPFYKLHQDLMPVESEIADKEQRAIKSKYPVSVELKEVTYSYPTATTPAITNISMVVKPGEMVAIIGPSGSGKSTLADIIIGLIEPQSGVVTRVTEDLKTPNVGYLPQNPGIIMGSILQNITLNVSNNIYDATQLERSLNFSQLGDLINELPEGINSSVGKQANALSGGQLQRIGLARALYTIPGLLVLDEATSSLDARTESIVSKAILSLKGKCTTVVIAHKLSTIREADNVIMIDKGKIVANGTFEQLKNSDEDKINKFIAISRVE